MVSATSGRAVVGAQVRVRELGRSDVSHADGSFHLENLREGAYTVTAQMLGYAPAELPVLVRAGETSTVGFVLAASALSLPGIVVTGVGRERSPAETYRPTAVLSGAELDRRLSWSLASPLRHQQGISMASFGPATVSVPVGLSYALRGEITARARAGTCVRPWHPPGSFGVNRSRERMWVGPTPRPDVMWGVSRWGTSAGWGPSRPSRWRAI